MGNIFFPFQIFWTGNTAAYVDKKYVQYQLQSEPIEKCPHPVIPTLACYFHKVQLFKLTMHEKQKGKCITQLQLEMG